MAGLVTCWILELTPVTHLELPSSIALVSDEIGDTRPPVIMAEEDDTASEF